MTNTNFSDTEVTFKLSLADVQTPYRYLNWISTVQGKFYNMPLDEFSAERQAAIAALIDNGLVSERRWTGGEEDGRVIYSVTPLGDAALHQAWNEADAVIRAS
jgi:hypothetical protein